MEIRPLIDDTAPSQFEPVHAKHVYKDAFEELFPHMAVPEEVGVTCCSQFAVRREAVWQKPREEYVRYRDWLTTSPLGDDLSGRVLEYSWHRESSLLFFFFLSVSLKKREIYVDVCFD